MKDRFVLFALGWAIDLSRNINRRMGRISDSFITRALVSFYVQYNWNKNHR